MPGTGNPAKYGMVMKSWILEKLELSLYSISINPDNSSTLLFIPTDNGNLHLSSSKLLFERDFFPQAKFRKVEEKEEKHSFQ